MKDKIDFGWGLRAEAGQLDDELMRMVCVMRAGSHGKNVGKKLKEFLENNYRIRSEWIQHTTNDVFTFVGAIIRSTNI